MSTQTNFMESKILLNFEDPSIVHDRVLVVGEKKFYVISGTLSMWSEHFRLLFNGSFNEADKKEIELKELDSNIFEMFLRCIYVQSMPQLKVADIISLIELSYRFLAPVVLERCNEFIDKNLYSIDDIMLNLLKTACEFRSERLKKKLTNYFKNTWVLLKFSCMELLELATEHKLDDFKNHILLFMKNHITVETTSEYLDCCEKFDLPDLKAEICKVVDSWKWCTIPEKYVIELTQSAFKHDLEILKLKVRTNIYCMVEEVSEECLFRAKYGSHLTTADTVNWFIRDNQKEITALPMEIGYFILLSACENEM